MVDENNGEMKFVVITEEWQYSLDVAVNMKKPLTRDNITEYMDKMSKVNIMAASLFTTWGHQDKQNCKHMLETMLSLTNAEQTEIIHAANEKKM